MDEKDDIEIRTDTSTDDDSSTTMMTKDAYLKAKQEYVERHSREFALPTGLTLTLRVVHPAVWSYILVNSGVSALALDENDRMALLADGTDALERKVASEIDAHEDDIVNALIARAGDARTVPGWLTASVMDKDDKSVLLNLYAIAMAEMYGNAEQRKAVENFREDSAREDVGQDSAERPGENTE